MHILLNYYILILKSKSTKLELLCSLLEPCSNMAIWYTDLPFLTCEVRYGSQALDIAGRQNAHKMSLAVRGVVEFYLR